MSTITDSNNSALPFKVVMLGDMAVGKTALVNRLSKNLFTATETTVGSNFASKIF